MSWSGSAALSAKGVRAGPERRKLKIKDPQRYSWQPKEVLAQIAAIYVHLGRADSAGVFAREIANDERCYRREMFAEAAQVICSRHHAHCPAQPPPCTLPALGSSG